MTAQTVVVMPAFNEAEGIGGFLDEIVQAFPEGHVRVIVVDDASSDGTAAVIIAAGERGVPVRVVVNGFNRGHGPSTLRALRCGLEEGADVIVAVDGDGQFLGTDIAAVAERAGCGIVPAEGCRSDRPDPWFRHLVSAVTRLLVRAASGSSPLDANTPLRAYPPSLLQSLLDRLPDDLVTPNLIISAMLRRDEIAVIEVPVQSLPRRGSQASGSTWGQRAHLLPSRRFIIFCWRAFAQWTWLRGGAGVR
jgi:glycosyltransferase involved in cell wall biosynthesis